MPPVVARSFLFFVGQVQPEKCGVGGGAGGGCLRERTVCYKGLNDRFVQSCSGVSLLCQEPEWLMRALLLDFEPRVGH